MNAADTLKQLFFPSLIYRFFFFLLIKYNNNSQYFIIKINRILHFIIDLFMQQKRFRLDFAIFVIQY